MIKVVIHQFEGEGEPADSTPERAIFHVDEFHSVNSALESIALYLKESGAKSALMQKNCEKASFERRNVSWYNEVFKDMFSKFKMGWQAEMIIHPTGIEFSFNIINFSVRLMRIPDEN